jgi:Tfp pilus assembly protein PilW
MFILGLLIGLIVGAVVMFLVYRNNITKLNNIAEIIQAGSADAETLKKLQDALK